MANKEKFVVKNWNYYFYLGVRTLLICKIQLCWLLSHWNECFEHDCGSACISKML